MKNRINLYGIRTYAFHGCLEAEARIGAVYRTDIEMEVDFLQAARRDDLSATVDYGRVAQIVKDQMAIRSRLIENVAWRIHQAVRRDFPEVKRLLVRVSKPAPPVSCAADRAVVEIED